MCLGSWVVEEDPGPSSQSRPGRYFCWLCFQPSKGQPSSPDVAFVRPPKVEGGERATASLAYGWESEIGAISEVLAEPAPCEMPVRSTQIRGAFTRAEGACRELTCPMLRPRSTCCYDLFGRLDCWSWVWDMITGFILLFHQCTIYEFAFLHLFVVVT